MTSYQSHCIVSRFIRFYRSVVHYIFYTVLECVLLFLCLLLLLFYAVIFEHWCIIYIRYMWNNVSTLRTCESPQITYVFFGRLLVLGAGSMSWSSPKASSRREKLHVRLYTWYSTFSRYNDTRVSERDKSVVHATKSLIHKV